MQSLENISQAWNFSYIANISKQSKITNKKENFLDISDFYTQ